ncbi:MAG: ScpA family protein [Nitrolancea sp.]
MNDRSAELLNGYQLRLPTYEGPLDVLLSMIERNQLAITDVSLVAVTEQFVTFTAGLTSASSDVLAEFMTIAARLLLLKSRSLLPRPETVDDEEESDDLVARLKEYQQVKLGAEDLRQRERQGIQSWPRIVGLPEVPLVEVAARTPVHTLVNALRRCMAREPQRPEPYTPIPVISLKDMTHRLLARLGRGRIRFSSLVGRSANRDEHAVAFIALLALLRQRLVEATQSGLFGEIEIERIGAAEPADD